MSCGHAKQNHRSLLPAVMRQKVRMELRLIFQHQCLWEYLYLVSHCSALCRLPHLRRFPLGALNGMKITCRLKSRARKKAQQTKRKWQGYKVVPKDHVSRENFPVVLLVQVFKLLCLISAKSLHSALNCLGTFLEKTEINIEECRISRCNWLTQTSLRSCFLGQSHCTVLRDGSVASPALSRGLVLSHPR